MSADPDAPQFGAESAAVYENASMGSQIIQPLSTQNSDAQLLQAAQFPIAVEMKSALPYQTSQYQASGASYQASYTSAAQYGGSSQLRAQYGSPSTLNSAYGIATLPAGDYHSSQGALIAGYGTGGAAQYSSQQYTSVGGFYTGQTGVSSTGQAYRSVSAATEGSRVVGHEYGAERVVSVTSRVDESRASIISERYVEHEVRVPKKIVREEVIEKTIVVPERVQIEEVIEEMQKVREKIVEIAKPTIVEKIVEVPEIEYIERIVEVPERIVQEKLVQVEKVIIEERIREVPKIIPQERIVEIPDIQYREVPFERVIEVPEYHEEVIVKEIPITQYIDKPVPQTVNVDVHIDIERTIPVPVEAVVAYEYRMPRMKPKYSKVTYPVYLPRFIEIPVAVELLNAGLLSQAEAYLASVNQLTRSAASLCEVETLAAQIMKSDFQAQLQSVDLQAAVLKAWQHNTIGAQAGMLVGGTGMIGGISTATGLSYTGGMTTSSAAYQTTTKTMGTTSVPMLGTTGAVLSPVPQAVISSSSHREHHKKSKRTSKKSAQ